MLEIVGYFVRLGLSVAIVLLNAGAAIYLLASARAAEHAKSVAKDMCYGAALLAAISSIAFVV